MQLPLRAPALSHVRDGANRANDLAARIPQRRGTHFREETAAVLAQQFHLVGFPLTAIALLIALEGLRPLVRRHQQFVGRPVEQLRGCVAGQFRHARIRVQHHVFQVGEQQSFAQTLRHRAKLRLALAQRGLTLLARRDVAEKRAPAIFFPVLEMHAHLQVNQPAAVTAVSRLVPTGALGRGLARGGKGWTHFEVAHVHPQQLLAREACQLAVGRVDFENLPRGVDNPKSIQRAAQHRLVKFLRPSPLAAVFDPLLRHAQAHLQRIHLVGLGQVIIGPRGEHGLQVARLHPHRGHQHEGVFAPRLRPHPAAKLDPVHAGQHHIEHHQIEGLRPENLHRLFGAAGGRDGMTAPGQDLVDQMPGDWIVFDNEGLHDRGGAANRRSTAADNFGTSWLRDDAPLPTDENPPASGRAARPLEHPPSIINGEKAAGPVQDRVRRTVD